MFLVPAQVGSPAGFDAAPGPRPDAHAAPARATRDLTPAAPVALASARPFAAHYGDAASAARAEDCLTQAIYYEGALEPEEGQRAIAQVVLNRVRHPAYPDNVCGVVFEGQNLPTGCQFSFTCDGSRARRPVPALWERARRVAKAALGGSVAKEVGLSTHYHADYVAPDWSARLDPSGQIGRHLFYRWRGNAGRPAAFTARYSGHEPDIGAYVPPASSQATGDGDAPAGTGSALPSPDDAAAAPPPSAPRKPFRARPLQLAETGARGE
ncbi:MAG: hypothetical protein GC147_07915 [Porphyrobacter sp.]|nr:hypothetical protein [Porphyrobacter sp.]